MDGDPFYIVNVEGVVVDDGRYLLIERAQDEDHASGSIAFPGGKVEAAPGTDLPVEATARRELAEEVGIEVGDVEYVHSRTFELESGETCLDLIVRCEWVSGAPSPEATDEVAGVTWMTPDEIRAHEDAPPYLVEDVARLEEHARLPE